jgi:hypothetical protein
VMRRKLRLCVCEGSEIVKLCCLDEE